VRFVYFYTLYNWIVGTFRIGNVMLNPEC